MDENFEKIPRKREESLCPCKSRKPYKDCCMPYHYGRAQPETAEQLMRSRYSAYFFRRPDYLVDTTHPDSREPNLKAKIEDSIHDVNWKFLTILSTSKGAKGDKAGKVEFIVDSFIGTEPHQLHEHSRFKLHKGRWKYLDGKG